jgi:hypothetical protein
VLWPGGDDFCGVRVAHPHCDPPSALTSGLVVYGSLTAALRGRRRRHNAWTENDIPSDPKLGEDKSQASTKFDEEFPLCCVSVKFSLSPQGKGVFETEVLKRICRCKKG